MPIFPKKSNDEIKSYLRSHRLWRQWFRTRQTAEDLQHAGEVQVRPEGVVVDQVRPEGVVVDQAPPGLDAGLLVHCIASLLPDFRENSWPGKRELLVFNELEM